MPLVLFASGHAAPAGPPPLGSPPVPPEAESIAVVKPVVKPVAAEPAAPAPRTPPLAPLLGAPLLVNYQWGGVGGGDRSCTAVVVRRTVSFQGRRRCAPPGTPVCVVPPPLDDETAGPRAATELQQSCNSCNRAVAAPAAGPRVASATELQQLQQSCNRAATAATELRGGPRVAAASPHTPDAGEALKKKIGAANSCTFTALKHVAGLTRSAPLVH
jgi:hypothetical protein